jgi:hypothetical protein
MDYAEDDSSSSLFTEQMREVDKFARVFRHFCDTMNDYFDCREFMLTKTWAAIEEFEFCYLEASVLLSAFDKEVAITKACHNIYHIFKMFGVSLDNSMDISASLFSNVISVVYLRENGFQQQEEFATVLQNELVLYQRGSRYDEDYKEIYDIFCFLGSIIYNYVGEEHTIYSNYEPTKRRI